MLAKSLQRIWNSPTVMSWGSLAARLLGFVVVLPLVLARFPAETVSVWLLFATLSGMQLLADMGFAPTFSRVIAYAMGGADITRLGDYRSLDGPRSDGRPNWEAVGHIVSTMRPIYARLALVFFGLLLVLGTWALVRSVSAMEHQASAWLAWVVVLCSVSYALYSSLYASYLLGTNHVTVLRRWEMLTGLGTVLATLLALFLFGDLLSLVIAGQAGLLAQVLCNRWLCHRLEGGRFRRFTEHVVHREVFDAVWPSAWRSGVAVFMGFGMLHASGIVYAQIGSAIETAAYLLALRLIQIVSIFSQAPFYTKLPQLARLRAQGDHLQQVQLAKRGMTWSYWTFVAGFVGVGLLADVLLDAVNSNTPFVHPWLWSLLGIAIFVERYGAMHVNLYSTTNHIISHVANGVSGLIFVAVSALLLPRVGIYAFPAGLLAGNLGFYAWYSALHSYRSLNLRFWSFERTSMLPALAVVLLYSAWASLSLATG
jgi:hypothetical protein